MSYIVKLENFEGPFDLLLQLIEQKHLNITELSLSKVTQDYLEAIEELQLSLEEMNWFLYVAARLVFTKSQRVLDLQTPDEPIPPDDLADSLKRYAALRKLTGEINAMLSTPAFVRNPKKSEPKGGIEISSTELAALFTQLNQDYQRRAKQVSIKSRSAVMARIRKKFLAEIGQLKSFSLQSTIDGAGNRAQAVVYFTTILDLLRRHKIHIQGEELEVVGMAV